MKSGNSATMMTQWASGFFFFSSYVNIFHAHKDTEKNTDLLSGPGRVFFGSCVPITYYILILSGFAVCSALTLGDCLLYSYLLLSELIFLIFTSGVDEHFCPILQCRNRNRGVKIKSNYG